MNHGLRDWWANIWDRNEDSQDGKKEFENPGRRKKFREIFKNFYSYWEAIYLSLHENNDEINSYNNETKNWSFLFRIFWWKL